MPQKRPGPQPDIKTQTPHSVKVREGSEIVYVKVKSQHKHRFQQHASCTAVREGPWREREGQKPIRTNMGSVKIREETVKTSVKHLLTNLKSDVVFVQISWQTIKHCNPWRFREGKREAICQTQLHNENVNGCGHPCTWGVWTSRGSKREANRQSRMIWLPGVSLVTFFSPPD